ncbi:uncharacterized protein LOC110007699 [Amborella trichopoda]|uniref:uncharacterized protein LOC110007699 n=1 Tax=Amborella trichopoda TaxID=13333 RepID=UPI0009C0E9FA|nr:uncharacterized protein LOC110007699 [Amborella trichopoda]XP_020525894.1 uncharacterized protein LOC110007699 [Amborella trichopoda]|eukprot:XP_020525893.1 uncharacterized protein LOC110007699 [Amborella trichopoda]
MDEKMFLCIYGGELYNNFDGSMEYVRGNSCTSSVHRQTKLDEIKEDVANQFSIESSRVSLKYIFPSNKRCLVTLFNDRDVERMLFVHEGCNELEIYVFDGCERMSGVSVVNGNTRDNEFVQALPSSSNVEEGNNEHNMPRLLCTWENLLIDIGQEFPNISKFRDALCKYAMVHHFEDVYITNENYQVQAKCKNDNCNWEIDVCKVGHLTMFKIETWRREHS